MIQLFRLPRRAAAAQGSESQVCWGRGILKGFQRIAEEWLLFKPGGEGGHILQSSRLLFTAQWITEPAAREHLEENCVDYRDVRIVFHHLISVF